MKNEIATREQQGLTPRGKAESLINAFLSGKSPKTIEAYGHDIEDFANFCNRDPNEAVELLLSSSPGEANAQVLAYRAYLLEEGRSPATVNRRLAALKSLTKLARTIGVIPWTLEVEGVRSKAYRDTRGAGVCGVQAIFSLAKGTSKKAKRDYAMLRLLYDLGLRRGEVVSLDLADIDLERSTLEVVGKGRREKELLTLPEQTKQALSAWIEARGNAEGALFLSLDRRGGGGRLTGTSLYRIVRDYGQKAGIKTRPHGLRHTAITEAVKRAQKAGLPLEVVRDFSRHSDIATVLIYRDRERNYQGEIASLVAQTV